ncbi:MAG: hypothetical protein ACJ739_04175 [Acidimicrobiales bacterium]
MTPVAARHPVTVRTEPGTGRGPFVVLEVGTLLDGDAGEALVAAAEAAISADLHRVDIDLTSLQSWTQEGAAALVRCRAVCSDLPDGLHYRTGRGPGRAALLAAYQ